LEDEVGSFVFICHSGTDHAEGSDVGDSSIVGGVGDSKHAVAGEGEFAHDAISLLKNMERLHGAWK
jgi:hypothetical protein